MNILMCKLISGMAVVCETLVVQLTGRRVVGDVYVWRPEEVLQRHEKARFQAATETDTETQGMF